LKKQTAEVMEMVLHVQSDASETVEIAVTEVHEAEADAVVTEATGAIEVVDHEGHAMTGVVNENVETSTLTTTAVMTIHQDVTEDRAEQLADMMEAVDDQVRLADDKSGVLSKNR
jgi:hypothetical protein